MSDPIYVSTPESVDLALEPAGLGSRFVAAVIDGCIQWGVTVALVLILLPTITFDSVFDDSASLPDISGTILAVLLLAYGLLFFAYKLVLEAFWNGQTVGKRAAGIRVVRSNGLPVEFLQVLIRNLMRVVDYLPGSYLVGAVAVLASKRNQRLGDMVAGTVVVRQRRTTAPNLPVNQPHMASADLDLLREHVLRLTDEDLDAARGFWERKEQFAPDARYRVAARIAEVLITRMNWQGPTGSYPEYLIEAVLYVRSR